MTDDEAWTLRCWTTREVARRCGLSRVTIQKWCRLGRVRHYRDGARNFYANLDDCMELARRVRRRDPQTGVVLTRPGPS